MMFCPACGDCRGNVESINPILGHYRCPICGHVFRYQMLEKLEKKMGKGNSFMFNEDNTANGDPVLPEEEKL